MDKSLTQEIIQAIEESEFLNVATCNLNQQPCSAPKFFLKLQDSIVYLVDYACGHTLANLKINPKLSFSLLNPETLIGYKINGDVALIFQGPIYKKLSKELGKRQVQCCTTRIIDGVKHYKKYTNFELNFPKKVVFLKVKITDVTIIKPSGKIQRKHLKK